MLSAIKAVQGFVRALAILWPKRNVHHIEAD
jgi:hypothetical protein